jgi:hypothetical protein
MTAEGQPLERIAKSEVRAFLNSRATTRAVEEAIDVDFECASHAAPRKQSPTL